MTILPLVTPDLDLRTFPDMPLSVARLRDSDIVAFVSDKAFRAAVLLWCAAWHQVPASSMPSDDNRLAHYAGFGRDVKGWLKIKDEAMRGFVLCADGRYYHTVIAAKAVEADNRRRKFRERTANATKAKRKPSDPPDENRNGRRNDPRNEHEGKGREDKKGSEAIASDASASPKVPIYTDSKHELWGEGIAILTQLGLADKAARSNIGRWLRDAKEDAQIVLAAIQRARDGRIIDPIPWITQALGAQDNGQHRQNGVGGNRKGRGFSGYALELARQAAEHGEGSGTD